MLFKDDKVDFLKHLPPKTKASVRKQAIETVLVSGFELVRLYAQAGDRHRPGEHLVVWYGASPLPIEAIETVLVSVGQGLRDGAGAGGA